jgi:transcription initiation factor IIF auxiliary subunit
MTMALRLKNTWEYVGNDRWNWAAFLDDGGSGELKDVQFVEYVLHPTFSNPVRKVFKAEEDFRLETNGWGTFQLKAFVHRKNGIKQKLVHEIKLEYDPAEGTSK